MNMWVQTLGVLLAVCSCASASQPDQTVFKDGSHSQKKPANVAIIGAGAGGASSAYHIAQYAEAAGLPVNITVFERNDYIGGRSTTIDAYNDASLPFELGGSIFVEINHVLVDAVKAFNLTTSTSDFKARGGSIPGPALAVWNGEKFVISQNSEGGWWDTAKLFYKYGLAPLRTMNLMKSVVGKFLTMYDTPIFPFSSLTQVAQDVGLLAVTAATGSHYLSENNIGRSFAQDIIQASTRVNYAQNLDYIHGLETMVCMAANGAMSVEGGNYQIFVEMIAASEATIHLNTNVTAIEKQQDGAYSIRSEHTSAEDGTTTRESVFDTVVLAAPYQFADLGLPASSHSPDKIPYVQLHVTLFTSPHLLSPAFFGLSPKEPAPHVVLTTLPTNEHPPSGPAGVGSPGFFSISLLETVINPSTNAEEYAYKIFSPEPLNSTFLSGLLGVETDSDGDIGRKDITWIHTKLWYSYPYELPRVTFEEIKLDDGLWYTSSVESFISTMETSAFMGKNVARLVVDEWVTKAETDSIGSNDGVQSVWLDQAEFELAS